MLFSQDRRQLRRYFYDAWRKARNGEVLTPLEQLMGDVIRRHPEYHQLLEADPEVGLDRDYTPDHGQTNPFLHLAMHIALGEQRGADRPPGIAVLHRTLAQQWGDEHVAEHAMMEVLGEVLWDAQRLGVPPDETAYLARLQKLVHGRCP
ncbi:MAG: DUF1841 family protein [Candidatus Competibacterales bacterium]